MKSGRVRRSGVGARWRWVVAAVFMVAVALVATAPPASAEFSASDKLLEMEDWDSRNPNQASYPSVLNVYDGVVLYIYDSATTSGTCS